MQKAQPPLLELKQVNMKFSLASNLFTPPKIIHAVKDVSLSIQAGETFGLVGESGCGKSTLGRTILRLYKPSSGQIIFDGIDIARLNESDLKPIRRSMQSIFQDPQSSLNPHMTVEQLVGESIEIHGLFQRPCDKMHKKEFIVSLLEKVGLQSSHLLRYPHEFSGGQRQRISIARALAVNPKFIICDEPLSALDVSIQAQVVNLLQDLQEEYGITYLFVAHDLAMVKHISDNIGVMYLGGVVEIASSEELYTNPLHPYTRMLLESIPEVPQFTDKVWSDESTKGLTHQAGFIYKSAPCALNEVIKGCAYVNRCPFATKKCYNEAPEITSFSATHSVACHLY